MTWDLTTLIDFSEDRFECVKALINFFGVDLRSVQYEVVQKINLYDDKTIDKGNLAWNEDTLSIIESLLNQYPEHTGTYKYISIGLGLHGYGELGGYSPYPEVSFKSNAHSKSIYIGQESDAVLLFGNHKAFRSESSLPRSGRFLDRNFVIETLKYICQKIKPKNLYLLSEEHVYIPWNYHFIFHDSPQGYAQDLADVIQLVLHGGDERYIDDRRNYKAGVSDNPGMTFCKRNRGHIETLQNFLLKYGTQLEQKGIPTTFTREYLEEAVLDACSISEEGDPVMDFFFVGEGLGVYAQPLLDRYCEFIFLSLISGLTEKEDKIPVEVS
jgi:hypothetical protein